MELKAFLVESVLLGRVVLRVGEEGKEGLEIKAIRFVICRLRINICVFMINLYYVTTKC